MGSDGRPSARTARHTTGRTAARASVSATCASAIVRSWALRRESASGSSVSGERRAPGLLGADVSGFGARMADASPPPDAACGDWCAVGCGAGGAAVGSGVPGAVGAAVWVRSRCRLRARRCRALRARLVWRASRVAAVSRVLAPASASSRIARPSSRWGVECPPVVCAAIGIVCSVAGSALGAFAGGERGLARGFGAAPGGVSVRWVTQVVATQASACGARGSTIASPSSR